MGFFFVLIFKRWTFFSTYLNFDKKSIFGNFKSQTSLDAIVFSLLFFFKILFLKIFLKFGFGLVCFSCIPSFNLLICLELVKKCTVVVVGGGIVSNFSVHCWIYFSPYHSLNNYFATNWPILWTSSKALITTILSLKMKITVRK